MSVAVSTETEALTKLAEQVWVKEIGKKLLVSEDIFTVPAAHNLAEALGQEMRTMLGFNQLPHGSGKQLIINESAKSLLEMETGKTVQVKGANAAQSVTH